VPLHATASGKAWLATLPVEMALQIVLNSPAFSNPDDYGPNVPRTVDRVMEDLDAVRIKSIASVTREAERGVSAMASVVRSGEGGAVVGTVSIAGPSVRMTEEKIAELSPVLAAAATDLSKLWPLRRRIEQHQGQAAGKVSASA